MLDPRAATDRGQVVPVFAAVLLVGLLLAFALVRLGVAADDRARAQAAADAAALAGVAAGEDAARDLARRNGATVESYADLGGAVEVVASVGLARAVARAEPASPTDAREPDRRAPP